METTLFYIGLGLGGFALVLRQIFKRDFLLSQRWLLSALHVLFMATVGALVGFVISSSTDLHGPTARWPVMLSIAGFLWSIFQVTRTSSISEGPPQLLADDLEWVETSFSAVLLAAVIMYCVVQAFKIPSGSMEETLLIGDHLFVNKFVYGIRIPFTEKRVFKIHDVNRGEIVVFQCPEAALSLEDREKGVRKDFIKRAMAIAGDEVMIKDKVLFVNGQAQNEPYIIRRDRYIYPGPRLPIKREDYQKAWENGELAQTRQGLNVRDNFGPITVPPHSYFVMGDNRDGSFDARFWGPLPNKLLKGKAWFVYWPFTRVKVIK